LRDYLNIGLKKQRTRKKHRNLIFLSIQNKRIVKHPKNYMNGHLNETEEKTQGKCINLKHLSLKRGWSGCSNSYGSEV
jgi:hypothetical protein